MRATLVFFSRSHLKFNPRLLIAILIVCFGRWLVPQSSSLNLTPSDSAGG